VTCCFPTKSRGDEEIGPYPFKTVDKEKRTGARSFNIDPARNPEEKRIILSS